MGNTVTICFANNKGGSGKSTSCSNVGAALAGMGKKVLMVRISTMLSVISRISAILSCIRSMRIWIWFRRLR